MKKLSKYSKVLITLTVMFLFLGITAMILDLTNVGTLFFTMGFIVIYASLMSPDEEKYTYVKKKNVYIKP